MKKWASRLAKITFVFAALFGIFVTILVNMGGDSQTLKRAMEDVISQSTGYAARIDTLHKVTFFPSISIEANGVSMIRPDIDALKAWSDAEMQKIEEERGKTPPPMLNYNSPDGRIETLKISMSFWDATFGLGRSIYDLNIQNAEFKAGSISHKPITVKAIEINETPEGKPYISADGTFGADTFNARINLHASGRKKRPKYKIGDESEFYAQIGQLSIQGVLRPRAMGGFHARDVIVSNNEKAVIETTLSFVRNTDKQIELDGDFMLPEHASNATIDWKIGTAKDDKSITGTMDAFLINMADFTGDSELLKLVSLWNKTFKSPDAATDQQSKIAVTSKKFISGNREITDYKGTLIIQNNQFNFDPSE